MVRKRPLTTIREKIKGQRARTVHSAHGLAPARKRSFLSGKVYFLDRCPLMGTNHYLQPYPGVEDYELKEMITRCHQRGALFCHVGCTYSLDRKSGNQAQLTQNHFSHRGPSWGRSPGTRRRAMASTTTHSRRPAILMPSHNPAHGVGRFV